MRYTIEIDPNSVAAREAFARGVLEGVALRRMQGFALFAAGLGFGWIAAVLVCTR